MRKFAMPLIASLLSLVVLLTCGGSPSGKLPPGALPVPTPSDPWYGLAGNVLISDRGNDQDGILDFLWFGFNVSGSWDEFLALHSQYPNGGFWIGGRVVVDSKNPLGFYFDPNTVIAAEVTAEGLQTSLDFIKQNPSKYADSPGCCWYVPAVIETVR